MPCNCDHLEANHHEAESKRVAEHLVYMHNITDTAVPAAVAAAAANYYGDVERVHEMTASLCELCREHESKANALPSLAEWWKRHKQADRDRQAIEYGVAMPDAGDRR